MKLRLKLAAAVLGCAALLAAALVVLTPQVPRAIAQPIAGFGEMLLRMPSVWPTPPTATPANASSGNVAAATATATIAAVAAKTNYLTGFDITSSGATAAAVVDCTVTGLIGGTATYTYSTVAGVAVGNAVLSIRLPGPMPASAVNTAIAVSCPTLGAGAAHLAINAYGFTL